MKDDGTPERGLGVTPTGDASASPRGGVLTEHSEDTFQREDGTWQIRLDSTPTAKFFELVSPAGRKLLLRAFVVGPMSSRVVVLLADEDSSNARLHVLGSTTVHSRSDLLASALSILLEAIPPLSVSGPKNTVSHSERPNETSDFVAPGDKSSMDEPQPPGPTS